MTVLKKSSQQPSTMADKIQDLEPGDEAIILNGNRTRIKHVEVVSAQDGIISVSFSDERGEFIYNFDAGTGLAMREEQQNIDNGTPVLTLADDPRVQVIAARGKHKDFRAGVEAPINEFSKEPTAENFYALHEYLNRWFAHSVGLDLTSTIEDMIQQPKSTRDTTSVTAQQHNLAVSRGSHVRPAGF